MSDLATDHDLEPDEPAPRRERIKRDAWMIGSTIIALATAAVTVPLANVIGAVPWAVVFFVLAGAIDLKLFGWGIERFDLIYPKEFREVADDGC
jgi:hypothetical protein